MKKKVLSAVLAATLILSTSMTAFATPSEEIQKNQQKYEEFTQKIDEITGEVYRYNNEIGALLEKIANNEAQIDEIKVEVENTEKEIETTKQEIADTEELLGKRLREFHKSGGQGNYLMLLFSAKSFGDLINKIDSTTRIVNIDKELVEELETKQESLDAKINSLEEKKAEIVALNEENQKALAESKDKKAEQEAMVEELTAEQEKFEKEYLAVSERTLVEYQISVIEGNSSKTELEDAISQLRNIRDNQIKSSIVIEEINEYIEKAKVLVAEKEEEERIAEEKRQAELAAQQAAQSQNSTTATPNRGDSTSSTVSGSASGVVSYAYGFLGTPYVYGATGPDSFDCSGFTSYVYRNSVGMEITRTTYSQMGVGTAVSYDQLQPGDLVFTYGGDHVGIYVGGGNYIHAPQPGDSVKVSPVTSFYCARRVL